ncbi:MAG: DUF616 domain-containing protein [Lachnospiraceae bacterium]|nr:DUF616 domain-containing protein [Lachnospiraceae bacterium]
MKNNLFKYIRIIISGYIFKRKKCIELLHKENEYIPVKCEDRCDGLKIAIYSVNTGDYDSNNLHSFFDDKFDYFIVSDSRTRIIDKRVNIVPIPDSIKTLSSLEKARYIKTHPQELFKGYDYTIFVDGNISIKSDIRPIINSMIFENKVIGIHKHQSRDCAYEEAKVVFAYGKAKTKDIYRQMKAYRKEGFPKHYGLFETNVIIRKMNEPKLITLMDTWWEEMEKYTKRDQLSFTYALWKNGMKSDFVYCIGTNSRKSTFFDVVGHK